MSILHLASMLLLLEFPWQPVDTAGCSDPEKWRLAFDRVANAGATACGIRPEFQRLLPGFCGGPASCALLCAAVARCQAFQALPACWCRLFVFDACSHGVKDLMAAASCSGGDGDDIFVRRLPGAAPGSLCPAGYSHTRNGSSYKVVHSPTAQWTDAKAACAADGGLAKLADGRDLDELLWLMSLRTSGTSYHLGGHQLTASADKKDNWVWDECNVSIDRSIWESGQPDAGLPGQGCACLYSGFSSGLDDFFCTNSIGYICECPTVF